MKISPLMVTALALASVGGSTSYLKPLTIPKKDPGLDLSNSDGTPYQDSKGQTYQRDPKTGVIRKLSPQ